MPDTGQGRGPRTTGGWTVDTYAAHNEAIRAAELKFQEERDRRYLEIAIEREKALKIKESADFAALQLAREIQSYKDEKANELREQISNERGLYASKGDLTAALEKVDATLKPVLDFVAMERGADRRGSSMKVDTRANIAILLTFIGLVITILVTLLRASSSAPPPVYYAPMTPGTLVPAPTSK